MLELLTPGPQLTEHQNISTEAAAWNAFTDFKYPYLRLLHLRAKRNQLLSTLFHQPMPLVGTPKGRYLTEGCPKCKWSSSSRAGS
jgi:hypothetical protein